MIPEKIRPFFEVSCRKNKDGNELIKGTLTCCASHDFEVFAEGEIKCGVFSKLYLLPENDRLALNARCKKCGRDIPVFDNSCDGYEKCGSRQPAHTQRKNVECIKCRGTSFPLTSRMSIRRISKNSKSLERRRPTMPLHGYGSRSNAAAAARYIGTS